MRNIRRSEKFEELVRRLASEPHPITKKQLFPTIRELMCFAASLGFQTESRVSLDATIKDVDGRRFGEHGDTVDLMYLLALAEEKCGEVLLNDREEDRILIFEEYANGGFSVIQKWLNGLPSDINGDQAILHGLLADKFLDAGASAEDAIQDVSF